MSTKYESKINQLLQEMPKGTVVLASWLVRQDYSHDLQQKYIRSNWLESIGKGAFTRTGETVDLFGALYALQSQAKKQVHIGGGSSLALLGFSHYIEMGQTTISLFAGQGFKLPVWFSNNSWDTPFELTRSNMLPPELALTNYNTGNFSVKVSTPARAMLECIELAPGRFDLEEAGLIMESLNALQPAMVQELLEKCRSIKAKRLFLYFAEKANHTWFKYLSTEKINLGKGKRSIVKQGVLIPKYQITIPKNLA
jgi:hypothetical protein